MSAEQLRPTPGARILRRILAAAMLAVGATATLTACLFTPIVASETPPAHSTAPLEEEAPSETAMTPSPSASTPTPTRSPSPTLAPTSSS